MIMTFLAGFFLGALIGIGITLYVSYKWAIEKARQSTTQLQEYLTAFIKKAERMLSETGDENVSISETVNYQLSKDENTCC